MNFYFSFLDDSFDAEEVEFVQWRLYWLHHKGDSLPYNALGALLYAKEMNTYSSLGSSFININNSSGYYRNKWAFV